MSPKLDLLDLDTIQRQLVGITGTPTDEPVTAPHILSIIGQEIGDRQAKADGLLGEIAQLRSVQNSVVPINRLPPELLSTIFAFCLVGPNEEKYPIRITHLCKHWRAVALGASTLWTNIVLDHPVGLKVFLERSKALPVHISMTASQTPVLGSIKLIASQYHRVRTFKLRVPARVDLPSVMNRLKGVAAPLLEELTIDNTKKERSRRPRPQASDLIPPPQFSGVPALRSLTCRSVSLPYIPVPNALTHLDLAGLLPTLPVLLDLLQSTPLLETLILDRNQYGGVFNRDGLQLAREVHLPHLRLFYMHTFPPAGIASLLSTLALPRGVTVELNAPLDIVNEYEELFPLGDVTPLALQVFDGGVLRRLEVLWYGPTLCLQGYGGADDVHSPLLHITADAIEAYPDRRFLGEWAFDVSCVETLVICGGFVYTNSWEPNVEATRWREGLAGLPALKTLRIMSLNQHNMLKFMAQLSMQQPEVLSPQLETLELVDLRSPPPAFWELVYAFVAARAVDGCLRTLSLSNVGRIPWAATGNRIAALKDLGVEVVLDE
ncbi:hypothetical protein C8Q78DRAFT_1081404 [Trametes maxima]|nr:hypothetical protein C8Q78DRAFT_1081404 [Trametes maxima]